MRVIWCIFFLLMILPCLSNARNALLVVDHTCTYLNQIPMLWIDSAQSVIKWHYATTSDGEQIRYGLDSLELALPVYNVELGKKYLPYVLDALNIFFGNEGTTYIEPQQYWSTTTGMNLTRAVLLHNPRINVSSFSWCTQLSSATEAYVDAYLDSMTVLENEFPNVTFVYQTSNARSEGAAKNRSLRNKQIRDYCIANNKVLFDFEELDCSWFNPATQEWEYYMILLNGVYYPARHPQYSLSEVVAHTTWTNCKQKAKATWWMMACLAGWTGTTTVDVPPVTPSLEIFPNPFSSILNIRASDEVDIFDVNGRLVNKIHAGIWQPVNMQGLALTSGVYYFKCGNVVKKGVFLK